MIIAKNDEAKRSRIWRIVFLASSALIVVIAVYLLAKLFTTNPLEGTWEGQDGNYNLVIRNNGTVTVNLPELLEDTNVKVKMDYSLNKDDKTISVKIDDRELEKSASKLEGKDAAKTLESALSSVTTTFDYSVDKNVLTLTEREYGEQMIFVKK